MSELRATYFDGVTSRPHDAVLTLYPDGTLELKAGEATRRIPRAQVQVEPRLSNGRRFIRFGDGSRCEVEDSAGVDAILQAWSPQPLSSWLFRLEASWTQVAVAALVLIAICSATIYFGLPWAARRVAFMVPANMTRQLGDQTLAVLDRSLLHASQIPAERRDELQAKFRKFIADAGDKDNYRIEFRSMGVANAFALPSGTIVITDELVKLARDDEEILGTLAHECGHVRQRHALRMIFQNSAVFVVIALVSGDVSSSAAFGSSLPTVLLQSRFSRGFEAEADDEAVRMMRSAGVPPHRLADMLQRLSDTYHETSISGLSYFQSHPPTPARIKAINDAR